MRRERSTQRQAASRELHGKQVSLQEVNRMLRELDTRAVSLQSLEAAPGGSLSNTTAQKTVSKTE